MLIILLFFIISLFAFSFVLFSFLLSRGGEKTVGEIISVDRMIPTGLRSLLTVLSKKESDQMLTVSCDYLLQILFHDRNGQRFLVPVSVNASMKIQKNNRIPYYQKGDPVPLRYLGFWPRLALIDAPEIIQRQRYIPKLILWGTSLLLSLSILLYMKG